MTANQPATVRRRLRTGVVDAMRATLIRRFVESEAVEIEDEWARCGWTQRLIARATRVATSLIAVFGPGDYLIITVDRWGGRGGRPQSGCAIGSPV